MPRTHHNAELGTLVTRTRKPLTGAFSRAVAPLALLVLTLGILVGPAATSAQAADQHVFDAGLSLTGNCTTSTADSVPDPGCPYPADHQPKAFNDACGVATDPLGYIYVASAGAPFVVDDRIDVFDPSGHFVTEIAGSEDQVCRLAVDSQGRIYATKVGEKVIRYTPAPGSYPPTPGSDYGAAVDFASGGGGATGVAIDPTNDYVYVATPGGVREYDPAGNLLATLAGSGTDVAVWHRGANFDIYTVDSSGTARVYDGVDHHLVRTVTGATTDTQAYPYASIAVDQANGDFYVGEIAQQRRVNQFSAAGDLIGRIAYDPFRNANDASDLALDGSTASPNQGYLYVTSGVTSGAHAFAFAPLDIHPPAVSGQATSRISTTTATLEGTLTANGADTAYRFEYTDDADFQANAWANATSVPIPDGQLGADQPPATAVSAPIAGLQPDTTYHFRLVATNHCNPLLDPGQECTTEGPDTSFATYPEPQLSPGCPNAAFRTGPSAYLPDCRAYELVTPPDSNGMVPLWATTGNIDISLAAPGGGSLLFASDNGALPGPGGNGKFDAYRAQRGAGGWASQNVSPSGAQARYPEALAASPDHAYLLWEVAAPRGGSLDIGGISGASNYVRTPDGSFELVGRADPGFEDDPGTEPLWITAGAGHTIFRTGGTVSSSAPQLRADAPPTGTDALYDRTPAGLHTVSLLPGNLTPAAGRNARYQGASADGTVVLFRLGIDDGSTPLYARVDNADTYQLAAGSSAAGSATFSCEDGTTDSATESFQWLRNGTPIPGATLSTYTTTAADAGTVVQCQLFNVNPNAGATEVGDYVPLTPAAASPPTAPPRPYAAPSTSGSLSVPGPAADRTLTCVPGSWGGSPTFAYQWYKSGVAIPGATLSTFTVTAGSLTAPATFQCRITGTNAGGGLSIASGKLDTSPAPSPAAPTITPKSRNVTVQPAGASQNGDRVFYMLNGNLHAFDTGTQADDQITTTGDITPVNISADGSHVYFTSPSQLDGQAGVAAQPNLYLWDGSTIKFIATLDPADVALAYGPGGGELPSLARWVGFAASHSNSALDSSRSTPDGTALVFESKARLTAYDNAGHTEIYRYHAGDPGPTCVSCNPTGTPAGSDARLQSVASNPDTPFAPLSPTTPVANLAADGNSVFFESDDRLVTGDTDGLSDVYEWKAEGTGGCTRPAGCIALISSGQSATPNYLYAVTPDGSDVFFRTTDSLLPSDTDGGVPSIYDAHLGGGFATESTTPPCVGDACQGQASAPPAPPGAASAGLSGPGNLEPRPRCAKGKHRVVRSGKARCVTKRHKKHHHRRAAR